MLSLLSSDDVKEKVGLLSAYPKNDRLLEALQELRDNLLDNIAWPVIMKWFEEGED